jgi:hypothetical protein
MAKGTRKEPPKLGRDGTGYYLTFGKHAWRYLNWMAIKEPEYLNWMLQQEFPGNVRAACQEALDWAQHRQTKPWSGPEQALEAQRAASARCAEDMNRIWKDKDAGD